MSKQTNVVTMSAKRRQRAMQRVWSKTMPGRYLGTYTQYGTFEMWAFSYGIEVEGEYITAYFQHPGREEDLGPDEPERVAEWVRDEGIEPEWFIEDLRTTDEPELVALGNTIEAIALAEGWVDKPLPRPAEDEKAEAAAPAVRSGHRRRERKRPAGTGSKRPILL